MFMQIKNSFLANIIDYVMIFYLEFHRLFTEHLDYHGLYGLKTSLLAGIIRKLY
jgi:hypothetical protein